MALPLEQLPINALSLQFMIPCKVCQGDSISYGSVDFNKNCACIQKELSQDIVYHRCDDCGLIFTVAFDNWSKAEFLEYIYNDDYVSVDPDYLSKRPTINAENVERIINKNKQLKLLDYGSGNGVLTSLLLERGYHAEGWDLFDPALKTESNRLPCAFFDLVSAFEVVEHSPTPVETFNEMFSFVNSQGKLLFSTYMIEFLCPPSLDFWYIAPRNGHVTLYTSKALQILAHRHEFLIHHVSEGCHIAYKK